MGGEWRPRRGSWVLRAMRLVQSKINWLTTLLPVTDNIGVAVIGPSTTQLFSNLSLVLNLPVGSEIIISSLDHEANISPWVRLARLHNYTIKWWPTAPASPTHTSPSPILTPENLNPLLSEKTALVTCTHASNVLGTIHDVKKIAEMVHTIHGATLCVDGVALAPHREVDVKALGVDFYAFSWYKVNTHPKCGGLLSLFAAGAIALTAFPGLWSPHSNTLRLPPGPTKPRLPRPLLPHRDQSRNETRSGIR